MRVGLKIKGNRQPTMLFLLCRCTISTRTGLYSTLSEDWGSVLSLNFR